MVGVGDVCSFAQMDIRKHGNPDWQLTPSTEDNIEPEYKPTCETNQYTQGEHGKTELSLMHFTKTNPKWKMPDDVKKFVNGINKHAANDILRTRINPGGAANTAMGQSLLSLCSTGAEYSSIIQSILHTNLNNSQMGVSLFSHPQQQPQQVPQAPVNIQQQSNYPQYSMERMLQQNLTNIAEDEDQQQQQSESVGCVSMRARRQLMSKSLRGGMSRREGAVDMASDGILASLNVLPSDCPPGHSATATDMCLSTLYLHDLHHRHVSWKWI